MRPSFCGASTHSAVASFVRLYGISPDSVRYVPESVDADSLARFAFLRIGDNEFELVQPIANELRDKLNAYPSGSAGINHVAWQVSDLDACLNVLQESGIGPGHVTPDGPIAYGNMRFTYLDPAATDGLLVELIEVNE